ncbi:hypothetical protein DSO57_1011870 [Entomophthora muscae]|uniref:Uncharacterized protein n=1 Tax=Entomophthora muscae TaxID=34485 RepID=A0ACC2S7Y8_9FUNG|nr:hypothetical protein DSO57_1011870 [Entomophthora muscae]
MSLQSKKLIQVQFNINSAFSALDTSTVVSIRTSIVPVPMTMSVSVEPVVTVMMPFSSILTIITVSFSVGVLSVPRHDNVITREFVALAIPELRYGTAVASSIKVKAGFD